MQDFNLAEPDRWPLAVKVVCCAVTALCVLAFGYVLFLANLRAERIGLERELDALRGQHEGKAAAASRLAAGRADRDHAATVFAAMLRRLPTQAELPAVIEDISHAALTRDLVVTDIALAPERETALYIEQPIAIAVAGDYDDIGAFTGDIAALAVLVTTHDFEIKPANGDAVDGGLTMTATLKTYRYLGEVPDAAMPEADNAPSPLPTPAAAYRPGKRDPFRPAAAALTARPAAGAAVPPSDGRTRQPLEHHPLAELRMVGTLAANGARHALFQAPDGIVHRVAPGDYLGADNGRLRSVHDAGVELVEVVPDGAGGWQERPRTIVLDETVAAENEQRRNP